MHGFDPEAGLPTEGAVLSENVTQTPTLQEDSSRIQTLQNTIDDINTCREEKIPFRAEELHIESGAAGCVYVSVDDIGVKHQKDSAVQGT